MDGTPLGPEPPGIYTSPPHHTDPYGVYFFDVHSWLPGRLSVQNVCSGVHMGKYLLFTSCLDPDDGRVVWGAVMRMKGETV